MYWEKPEVAALTAAQVRATGAKTRTLRITVRMRTRRAADAPIEVSGWGGY